MQLNVKIDLIRIQFKLNEENKQSFLNKFIIKIFAKEVHYTVNHETGEKVA
jgi:hypothetical protein